MIKQAVIMSTACFLLGVAAGCGSTGKAETKPAAAKASAPAVSSVAIERGRGIYKANCAPCHGESGKGDGPAAGGFTPAPRDHTDRAYMSKLTDLDLAQTIQYGGAMKGKPMMPPSPQLRGDDLDAVVAYVRMLSAPKQAGAGAGQ
jgi:mono/diheme cytochrome c family protein